MSTVIRIALIVVSLFTFVWIERMIKKSKAKIEDAVFWILFSILLVIISIFPDIIIFGAKITGVQSPVNFVYLVIIFILLIKLFMTSLRISSLEYKVQTFAQRYAIDHKLSEDRKKAADEAEEETNESV